MTPVAFVLLLAFLWFVVGLIANALGEDNRIVHPRYLPLPPLRPLATEKPQAKPTKPARSKKRDR